MHFIGFGFQPTKVAFDSVPGVRPLVQGIFPVIWFALDYQVLPLFGELFERNVGGHTAALAVL